jgi:hypothetical protein
MYRQESDNAETLLAGEGQLLELIFEGAPLPQVLDKVCTALDVQVGNVVSLVLFPDDEEHTLHTIAQSAASFGLTAFSCTAILSPSEEFFGTLEIYCCFPRKPNLSESELIERAAHLAALAIQHYRHDVDAERCSLDWTGATCRSRCDGPPSAN